ncbi:MAG: leucine-rich repeat domain-containing protein [Psychroflexus sp.]
METKNNKTKAGIQIALIFLIMINLTTACQKQTKYDGDVKVEYTPRHVNLIRPIVEPERIYYLSLHEKRFKVLPEEMKKLINLRRLVLAFPEIDNWEETASVINSFSKLEDLEISATELNSLPFNPEFLPYLKKLNLIATKGYSLDEEIDKITQFDSLEFLCVSGHKTDHLPEKLADLENLKRFHFGYHAEGFDYERGIEIVSRLPKLEHVQFDKVEFETIPKSFSKLHHLKRLGFYNSAFDMKALLKQVKDWEDLEMLEFKYMDITTLPESIIELESLKTLKLYDNPNLDHQKLFRQLSELPHLEELVISKTILQQQHDRFVMPRDLGGLKNLKRLNMATSQNIVFDSLFDVLTKLPKLEYLSLKHVYPYFKMDDKNFGIPSNIKQMRSLKELDLERSFNSIFNEVDELPELEKLNWANSSTGQIPEVILKTTSLKSLNLNSCELKELPKEIGNLTNLVHLDLGNNQLKDLPESITKLKNLRYLNLMGTHISESEEKRKEIEEMLPNTLIFFGEYEAYEPL